jgi:hypothetical protein
LGLTALRREQFEGNHHENQALGRKVTPSTDVTSTALGKEELAVHLQDIRDV